MARQPCITPNLCNDFGCAGRCGERIDPPRPDPVELAKADARDFGCGFVRTHPDGTLEHIPPDQIVMHTRPNNQEA